MSGSNHRGSWWTFFWEKFLYGMFLIPFVGVYAYWDEGDLDEVTQPATIAFFVVWEVVVLLIARAKRVWPLEDR